CVARLYVPDKLARYKLINHITEEIGGITMKEKGVEEGIRPKYPVLRVSFVIISIFCYVMLGFSILFFILGIIGIVLPPLLFFLPVSLVLAIFAFVLLIQVRMNQLMQDIEMNTRQMAENLGKRSERG
ncbi:MAG: hypothetical protein QMD05_10780, partial [Candidatus Brocadiaceae bacterium]|nr:hypothetical protein [Candidatus Brocadiaceae bacterium]